MPARKRLSHDKLTREKIQTSQLINRLTNHILSDNGLLNASQVTAALGLIKKTLPDLSNVELTGKDGGSIKHDWVIEVIDAKSSNT